MVFADRGEAGRALAAALGHPDPARTVVLALPRGGVPVAAEVCRQLGLPLDLVLVRKVGVPGHEELAAGAIAEGPGHPLVENAEVMRRVGLDRKRLRRLAGPEERELERRRARYLGDRPRPEVAGKTVILVDDGLATGATRRAAIPSARARTAARVVVAVPVGAPDTVALLRREADEVICLEMPEPFFAVGRHYARFDQVEDGEVVAILESIAADPRPTP
jgi:putative phosphoribosyl transferase